jgi:hypothetical protein
MSDEHFGKFVQRCTSSAMGRAFWPLLFIVSFACFDGARSGVTSDCLTLSVGAIVAGVAMFFHGLISVDRAYGKPKSAWMAIAAFGGFMPYIFALYVIAYRGLWSLREVTEASGIVGPVMRSTFLVFSGFFFLRCFWGLTELGRRVDRIMSIGRTVPENT